MDCRKSIIDYAISKVLDFRRLSTKNTKLTEQDLFYREVSHCGFLITTDNVHHLSNDANVCGSLYGMSRDMNNIKPFSCRHGWHTYENTIE